MTVSTRSTMVVDDATRQSLTDLVTGIVNTVVERLRHDLLHQRHKSSIAATNKGLEIGNRGNSQFNRVTKIEFSKFGGDDVRALMWHIQFVKIMGEDVDWHVYRGSILKRFGVAYDDPLGEIKKLKQTSNVREYIYAYDWPRNLAEMYGLCKLEEEKVNVGKHKHRQPNLPTPRFQNQFLNSGLKPMALLAPNINWRNKTATSSPSAPFRKQLTKKELEENRAKNQCFYCDQKGIIILILGGFAWCYTHAYIEDGVTFIAKSSVTFLAKRYEIPTIPRHKCCHNGMQFMMHRQFENSSPYDMIKELKAMFEKQAGVERFDLIQTFHACKQEEGKPVAAYVIQMKGYVDQLERLGYMLPQDLIVGLILNGLTKDFAGFVRNYNMHNMGKTIGELHAMLIEYEKGLPKKAETPQVMMIKGGKIQKAKKKSLKAKGKGKANGKGNDKQVYIPKPKNLKPSAKEHPAKDDTCHYCKEVGHWKRNCHVYLAELLKKKKQVGSWLCQFFREARKLKQRALYLRVGNGVRAQVEAIGSYDLVLPNGLVICLDNCHYAPSITRGVVSVHRLVENRFVQCFINFGISVSKNNVFYFNVIPSNGIYEIDMHDLVPNDNYIYNVSTKRAKHNLDSTYLWHCRLAHISKKRIKKLQQEGLLKSTDDESFDQCVSCLSGKMTRKSFLHRPERATDLFGIIHTDVCGPLRHVSRQGASYFITFTDDYSRYGYVYLLKHKHEVFETFKVFKNEVENQLGKTIKAIRSDQGGEYISQEFIDYLKACGIVQHLTPSYTSQHNGVSERRNRTLLDMVRFMMNLTTLPLSFWDYALESTTRILNTVPTKKVDKTPCELWYGKVLNLSYLKVRSCTDNAKISRKRSKPDNHGHGNGRAHKEPGECYQKSTVVNSSQPMVNSGQPQKDKTQNTKSVPQS
ncbi:retrotransposon protein, putative, ty1-copia subclass [Tanacetum coccineum]